MLRLRLILVKLLVFHEHDCYRQVQEEERADDDAGCKVEVDEPPKIRILIDVHNLCPALHGDALENGKESSQAIVEVRDSIVEFFDLKVLPNVKLVLFTFVKWVYCLASAVQSLWTWSIVAAKSQVCLRDDPCAIR